MNAAKQLALAAEALHACGFRGRANKLRGVADELALTEAAFDGIHAQLAAVAAERDALSWRVDALRGERDALSAELGDTSGTPSMIGGRVRRILGDRPAPMPPIERVGWYRELARMLSVAADKWERHLAEEAARADQ